MKLFVWGNYTTILTDELKRNGFELIDSPENADIILTHGGDGTFFSAEQKWPQKLKFPMRDDFTAPLCPRHGHASQFNLLKKLALKKTLLPKLCGRANGKECFGINDVYLHNGNPTTALRYSVSIDGIIYAREVVGDAVGCSTVHGSTAYYRSITHSTFRTGIGLAFSNSTELVDHIVLNERSIVKIEIMRGNASLVADNSPNIISVSPGETAEIFLSDLLTPVLGLDVFMCSECRRLRHTLRDSSRFLGGNS